MSEFELQLESIPEPSQEVSLTRAEWTRRFADRIKEICGWDEASAMACAEASAEVNLQNNGDEWLDPEDDADVEISYFDNDESEAA